MHISKIRLAKIINDVAARSINIEEVDYKPAGL